MNYIFCDFETTSSNPYHAEAIEAYFEVRDKDRFVLDKYHFKSKVNNWSDEAEAIHKISYNEHVMFDDKKVAWKKLYEWLNKQPDFTFICYVNHTMYGEDVWYDHAVLCMELMDYLGVNSMNNVLLNMKDKISAYDVAKKCQKLGHFDKYENFKQENVYYAIFDRKPRDSHRAVSDVKAMIDIYYWCLDALENKTTKRNQMQLL